MTSPENVPHFLVVLSYLSSCVIKLSAVAGGADCRAPHSRFLIQIVEVEGVARPKKGWTNAVLYSSSLFLHPHDHLLGKRYSARLGHPILCTS